MHQHCVSCHQTSINPAIDETGARLICAHCDNRIPFRRLPVYHLIGACGAGKTTTLHALRQHPVTDRILIDTGHFFSLRKDWQDPSDGFSTFKSFCLSVAFDTCQAGLPVMLLGATTPHENERLPERRYFSQAHYLALVCDDRELEQRLGARPWWNPDTIPTEVAYNRWLKTEGPKDTPSVTLIDTSECSPDQVAARLRAWLRAAE